LALSERDRVSRGLVVRDVPSALLTMRVEDLSLRSALARVSKDEAAVRESWFETRPDDKLRAASKDGEIHFEGQDKVLSMLLAGTCTKARAYEHACANLRVFFPGTNPATAAYRVIKPGRLP